MRMAIHIWLEFAMRGFLPPLSLGSCMYLLGVISCSVHADMVHPGSWSLHWFCHLSFPQDAWTPELEISGWTVKGSLLEVYSWSFQEKVFKQDQSKAWGNTRTTCYLSQTCKIRRGPSQESKNMIPSQDSLLLCEKNLFPIACVGPSNRLQSQSQNQPCMAGKLRVLSLSFSQILMPTWTNRKPSSTH